MTQAHLKKGNPSAPMEFLNVICLPTKHQRALGTHSKVSVCSRSNWNLEMLVFVEGGKPEYPQKNSQSSDKNKLNPHMTLSPGIEPRPHWWEASALTTVPSLLSGVELLKDLPINY